MIDTLHTELYLDQKAKWPTEGKHILAQFDDSSVIVYQAYRAEIGRFAAKHQYFGGEFSLQRMSWIKPNFLWMMYRSGWGTKVDQETTLAIRLKRTAFDEILGQAVPSSFDSQSFTDQETWQKAVASSDVRLQWDPDHSPTGAKLERRAIQLGLRGQTLSKYSREWILEISDISEFVALQRENVGSTHAALVTPAERIYIPQDDNAKCRLGLAHQNFDRIS